MDCIFHPRVRRSVAVHFTRVSLRFSHQNRPLSTRLLRRMRDGNLEILGSPYTFFKMVKCLLKHTVNCDVPGFFFCCFALGGQGIGFRAGLSHSLVACIIKNSGLQRTP